MAGHARMREVRSLLNREAALALGADATALDYVEYRTENGATLLEIADEVSIVLGYEVKGSLVRQAAVHGHDERAASDRLTASRARGAGALMDDAKHLIDNVAVDRDAIAKAKEQVNVRQFIASRWNRADWGEQKGPSTSITIGSLHIGALRARKVAARITDVMQQESEAITDVVPLLEAGDESGM